MTAALATRHGKVALISEPLRSLGLTVVVADVDTDQFGTFSGERERIGTPPEVVEAKARAAIAASEHSLGLASEGSFTTHPDVSWLSVDTELVALVDGNRGVVVLGRSAGVSSAASTTITETDAEVRDFCRSVGFPAQGLIVRAATDTEPLVAKGIDEVAALGRAVTDARRLAGRQEVRLEIDLRAHLCPSRRPVIRAAAEDLARRLGRTCDACGSPGVGILATEPGRPCALCSAATSFASAEVHGCPACSWTRRRDITEAADPAQCGNCNP